MKTKKVYGLLSVLAVMLMAWAISSCSKSDSTPPTNFTTLNTEIATAQALLSSTTEGVGTGEYQRGSQAVLQTAIMAAQAVAADTKATQADVTNATANLTAAVAAYQAAAVVPIAPDNLVGQWTFDELTAASVGTAVKDYSGNNNNGTLQAGAPYWSTVAGYPYASYPAPATNIPTITADRYGNQHALHFLAGANVDVPYNASLNPQSITISLWAKADTLPNQTGAYQYFANNYMVALNRWNGYKFQLQNSPRAFFTADLVQNGAAGNYDNQDNNVTLNGICKWLHYVVTFSNGSMAFYINGINTYTWSTASEAGTMALLNGAAGSTTAKVDLTIGQDLPTAAYTTNMNDPNYLNYGAYFIGAIDDVRIYNTALTAAQVQSIYNLEKP